MKKWIYHFTKKTPADKESGADGSSSMKDLLGGKGANLAEMCNLGLPIPPGFTIITELCEYYEKKQSLPQDFRQQLEAAIAKLEMVTGKKFGCSSDPLLVSVRSGAKISMPGMMDTILNLGINDEVMENLAQRSGNRKFALDSFRRFLEMYGSVVLEVSHYLFEETLENIKMNHGIIQDQEMDEKMLEELIDEYKTIIRNSTGNEFDSDPKKQIERAIIAVLNSWHNPRAALYRKINDIEGVIGTAVNIQSMVFGNLDDESATGVVFTRNPTDGTKELFGEYLINAQGEDVVAGIRTPSPLLPKGMKDGSSMLESMGDLYRQLEAMCYQLEEYFGDMQDIEFTIQHGKLFLLQTRKGKRSAAAAIKIAVDMVAEGKLTKEEAIMRIDPESINQLLHTAIDYSNNPTIIASGLPASPGAATGIVVFSPYDAEELASHHKVILVRNDTSPEDIKGMHISKAIVTARGGMTSHAAVVARGMGCPCICGVNGLVVNEKEKFFTTRSGQKIKQGDVITVDGASGNILVGDVELVQPVFSDEFKTLLNWSDQIRSLGVRTNAETPLDARVALGFGAEGIGLCRTEHMFFDNDKIPLVREMIIAPDLEHKMQAIENLKPLQMADFKALFKIMDGRPVNIRLLDPPLHEFLPTGQKEITELAESLDVSVSVIEHQLHVLHELNPMLGHRGCRLGITNPEIYHMQVDAILEAIAMLYEEEGVASKLELMIPLISTTEELLQIKKYIVEKRERISVNSGRNFDIKIGTMIELPRACLIADQIAPNVDYFSFGTNDLTQTTFGVSRDDIGSFLPQYLEKKIMHKDPFIQIDIDGVGRLVRMAVESGRIANAKLTFGVCGEHAGNPPSIDLFQDIGLDYVSCSPYRIPIARVAAAQSKIRQARG